MIRIVFVCLLLLLIVRVGYVSLYIGQMLAKESVDSHLLRAAVLYERGDIYDRSGVQITNQSETFYVAVFPALVEESDSVITYLAELTGRSTEELERRYRSGDAFCLRIEGKAEVGSPMRGVVLFAQKNRYDSKGSASHVLGYVQEDGRIGVSGIEEMCNDSLVGEDYQYLQAVTDGAGRVIHGAPYRLSGQYEKKRIMVTLDWEMQRAIEGILDKHEVKGSVIVMGIDGDILAMVSRPTFHAGQIAQYLSKDDAPLLNRAIQPVALGSVFKVVTALAGLESGLITMQDSWEDAGRIEVAGITFHGWDDREGYVPRRLTLTEAMAHSSNSVFIQIGTKIGGARIVEMAKRLGFGKQTIANYTEEEAGNLPNGDHLYIAEVANLAIGQGALLATPMQVTKMMAIVANGGYEVVPHLLMDEKNYARKRIINEQTARSLQEMLAVSVDDGTGELAQSVRGQAAGKTGSAETGRTTPEGKSVNHAWFSGYFPRYAPRCVCTVMIEEGNSGGYVAAPIFREIMEIIHQKKQVFS